jgi:hypothetical protein
MRKQGRGVKITAKGNSAFAPRKSHSEGKRFTKKTQ